MHVTILCYPLVCVHCGPVVDFFITKQTSLHPFDFVRNLFHLLVFIIWIAEQTAQQGCTHVIYTDVNDVSMYKIDCHKIQVTTFLLP